MDFKFAFTNKEAIKEWNYDFDPSKSSFPTPSMFQHLSSLSFSL